MTRRTWLLPVVTALLATLLVATLGWSRGWFGGASGSPAAPTTSALATGSPSASPSPSLSTSPSATASPSPSASPEPTAYAAGTFDVETISMTFVDPTRGTMARGARAATNDRTLLTTIRFPVAKPGGAPTACPCPVVLFAEGFNISAAPYAPLLADLTSRGYVVAAPEFPLASTIYEGPASQADLDNQPGDVSFVLTRLIEVSSQPGVLGGMLAPDKVAVMGHSDGAAVAAVIGYDPTFRDQRFGAAVILSGQAGDIHGPSGLPGSPPGLIAHGTDDEINPFWIGGQLYAAIAPPRSLLTIAGGRHLEPFTDAPIRPAVSEVIAAFLDLHLRQVTTGPAGADPAARLANAGTAPGLTLQSS